jgi:prepilin-type N-terminal cleavage/methylation domain-containing protein
MNNKGFTTIELILAIAIAGIVMGAIGSFLTFNLRGFNATTDVIDIQYEGQLAMNQLTNIARESTGVLLLDDEDTLSGDDFNSNIKITPNTLRFEHKATDPSNSMLELTTVYDLVYDEIDNEISATITENDGSTITYVIARYIEAFTIKPGDGLSFGDTKSIQMTMRLEQGAAHLDLQTHVKFRNKH